MAVAGSNGCGAPGDGREARDASTATPHAASLAVNVLADTGRSRSFAAPPPTVNISIARTTVAPAGGVEPPMPEAAPDTVLPGDRGSPDEPARLLPPILRRPATVAAPAGLKAKAAIDLEVRVDARGRVIDVQWAGGTRDSALVLAARRCAASMEFYPALLGGKPIEVWCRQRFEFTPR